MASLSFLIGAGLSLASLQTPPPEPNAAPVSEEPRREIIVEEPATDRERRNELRRLARDVLNRPRFAQALGSYAEPVCPKVFGLPEADAAVIEARMRANAVEFGLNHKDFAQDCTHNTSVIFVPESQGKAQTWFDYDSKSLDHLLSYERQRVLSEKGPVRAWIYRPAKLAGPVIVPSSPSGSASDSQRLALMTSATRPFYASRLNHDPNPLAGAAVLIELPEASGKSLIQLADYASLRSFGNARGISPDEVPAARTILTLFQDEDAPAQLTAFDKSLLTMLYRTPELANKTLVYGNIARHTARLETEEKVQEDQQ